MVLGRSQSFVSLFDIRIKSTLDRNVLVLRGTPEEASSVLLIGSVVFAVNDPMSIRKITLRLTGTMRLNWIDNGMNSRGPVTKPVRYEATLFEHDWNNLGSGGVSNGGSSSSLNSSSNTSTSTRTLTQGNHELPFEMIIPGDAPESVEGLESGQMVYRLVATVERGRFSNNLVAKKHIRIVRTIGSDAFELSQTVSIENTWPGKVEYTIEIPSKAVAIGASLPVHFHMVPLLKGLKLGPIKMQLVEFTSLSTPFGQTHSSEKICADYTIAATENGFEGSDAWDLDDRMSIPASLSKCTQDCNIGSHIKVSHKMKFAVSLVNPDGHVSELRASLPVYLFISPNVPVSYLDPAVLAASGGRHEEEVMFANSDSSTQLEGLNNTSSAPPNYEDHIYDRLWNEVPTPSLESPDASAISTPFNRSRRNSLELDGLGMTSLDAQQRSQLAAGLRALELQQHNGADSGSSSRSASGSNTPGYPPPANAGDYFQISPNQMSTGPIPHLSPDYAHLSRVGSPLLTPHSPEVDVQALSRVPSYSTAIRSDGADGGEMAPGYEKPSGNSSPTNSTSPLAMPSLAHVSAALRRHPSGFPHSHTSSTSASSSALSAMTSGPSSSLPRQVGNGSGTTNSSGSVTRNSSSSALNFSHRSSSSRSLFEEASRLVRLHDKKDKHK